ncbi:MAG: hypothetical protein RI567_03035 [Marinobacter sp.]|nr:hypothetical protein [Marinobacter sp.]
MAQNTAADSNSKNPGAVLHPGRAADPAPESGESTADITSGTVAKPATAKESPERATAEAEDTVDHGDQKSDDAEAEESAEEIERSLLESKQRKLRLMLRQCDRVLLLDFNLLAMSDWPDNFQMAAARRNRDLWVFSALAAASVFLSGLTGYVPAWLAGGGFGAFVIILLLGVPFVRRLYTTTPSYVDLLMKRQRMMRDARKHAEHLEGKDGLVWQCARMADYNPTLRHARFRQLVQLSEHRMLPAWLTRRDRVRLFLIYLLEAEKAYGRVQHDFFEGNQKAIDEGWESVAAAPQDRA